jgi:hypothetical protein
MRMASLRFTIFIRCFLQLVLVFALPISSVSFLIPSLLKEIQSVCQFLLCTFYVLASLFLPY